MRQGPAKLVNYEPFATAGNIIRPEALSSNSFGHYLR